MADDLTRCVKCNGEIVSKTELIANYKFWCYDCNHEWFELKESEYIDLRQCSYDPSEMNFNNDKWDYFISELGNMEECDNDFSYAKLVLKSIPNIDIEKSIRFFKSRGGHCDCEILINTTEYDR